MTFPFLERIGTWDNKLSPISVTDWEKIRELFPVCQWEKTHFNSGSAGVMPIPVQDYLISLIREMNAKAPYKAWSDWQETKKANISRLAGHLNAEEKELMVVRNTTEALNMIIYGVPLDPGDEVIAALDDYPFALNAIEQRAKRDGIIPVKFQYNLDVPEDHLVAQYEEMITRQTKAMLVTYMTHKHGHIMPVKKLTEMAHAHGVQVILDAAHAFGHFTHDIKNLDVDYYATSLHKWLNAPHGTGLIYCKEKYIAQLLPHPSSYPNALESMDKYEHLGTRAFHQEIGISAALDFYEWIGPEVKEERLQHLKLYWTTKVAEIKGVKLYTDTTPSKSCGVACFGIEGYSGGQLVKILDEEYDIHAKSVGGKWGSGVRISVNIFTNTADLDALIEAIYNMANSRD